MNKFDSAAQNGSEVASIFDGESMSLYSAIRADLTHGTDVSDSVERLLVALEAGLGRVSQSAVENPNGLAALNVQKRVVHEILRDLLKRAELGPRARDSVGRVLGHCSVYARLLHPRYHVTQDWFTPNVPIWREVLGPFRNRPDVRCLEIGSFEGLSACWLLEHILVHETSRIVCIDPFDAPGQLQAERCFDHNVRESGAAHKLTKLKGYSHQVLPLLAGPLFDIAYIDGSHDPGDTLRDALLVWPLVRPGGVILFDDYAIGSAYPRELVDSVDPKPGIDAFLDFISGKYRILSNAWQLIISKVE
ncbi:MAG TPA: class I SAM-dependent methyltransferase [Polyangiaceae bacterium]